MAPETGTRWAGVGARDWHWAGGGNEYDAEINLNGRLRGACC